jgi:hypothetical protein
MQDRNDLIDLFKYKKNKDIYNFLVKPYLLPIYHEQYDKVIKELKLFINDNRIDDKYTININMPTFRFNYYQTIYEHFDNRRFPFCLLKSTGEYCIINEKEKRRKCNISNEYRFNKDPTLINIRDYY